MKIECPRCQTTYVDPSPAAMIEPKACPWCSHNTAAIPSKLFDIDNYKRAREAMGLPAVAHFEVWSMPGSTDVEVFMDGEPVGVLTAEQWEQHVKAEVKP